MTTDKKWKDLGYEEKLGRVLVTFCVTGIMVAILFYMVFGGMAVLGVGL